MGSTQTLNLDDLTAPVLTDVQRQILDYTESRQVTFDIDAMLAEAVAGPAPTTSPTTTASRTGSPPTSPPSNPTPACASSAEARCAPG